MPIWSTSMEAPERVFLALLLIGHVFADFLVQTSRVSSSARRSTLAFVADQAAHVAGVLVLWRLLASHAASIEPAPWAIVAARWGVIAAGIVFNVKGGTAIVRRVLENYPQVLPGGGDGESSEYAMGRTIGHLERFLVFTFVLLGEWGALGFVIAAKSIARFRELSSQRFADYYLIGTLTSISVAVATGLPVRLVLFS